MALLTREQEQVADAIGGGVLTGLVLLVALAGANGLATGMEAHAAVWGGLTREIEQTLAGEESPQRSEPDEPTGAEPAAPQAASEQQEQPAPPAGDEPIELAAAGPSERAEPARRRRARAERREAPADEPAEDQADNERPLREVAGVTAPVAEVSAPAAVATAWPFENFPAAPRLPLPPHPFRPNQYDYTGPSIIGNWPKGVRPRETRPFEILGVNQTYLGDWRELAEYQGFSVDFPQGMVVYVGAGKRTVGNVTAELVAYVGQDDNTVVLVMHYRPLQQVKDVKLLNWAAGDLEEMLNGDHKGRIVLRDGKQFYVAKLAGVPVGERRYSGRLDIYRMPDDQVLAVVGLYWRLEGNALSQIARFFASFELLVEPDAALRAD
jgi:hypothetical protein